MTDLESQMDAVAGAKVECPDCKGEGYIIRQEGSNDPYLSMGCPQCEGEGRCYALPDKTGVRVKCSHCGGRGYQKFFWYDEPTTPLCASCHGRGWNASRNLAVWLDLLPDAEIKRREPNCGLGEWTHMVSLGLDHGFGVGMSYLEALTKPLARALVAQGAKLEADNE